MFGEGPMRNLHCAECGRKLKYPIQLADGRVVGLVCHKKIIGHKFRDPKISDIEQAYKGLDNISGQI